MIGTIVSQILRAGREAAKENPRVLLLKDGEPKALIDGAKGSSTKVRTEGSQALLSADYAVAERIDGEWVPYGAGVHVVKV